MRELFNAIFYVLRGGVPWRMLPEHFPPHQTAYRWFTRFRDDGTWESLNHHLVALDRERVGREAGPTAAVIDTQSVKSTEAGGPRGFDAAKKIKGRKRHILVDTQGFLLKVKVHTADIADRDGGILLLERIKQQFPRIKHLWVDVGYRGRFVHWATETLGWEVEVVKHWWQTPLHNQRAQLLKLLLLVRGNKRIMVINIPWYL